MNEPLPKPKNTHHTADLLFYWLGFDPMSKSVGNSTEQAKQLNPNKKTGGQSYSDAGVSEYSLPKP